MDEINALWLSGRYDSEGASVLTVDLSTGLSVDEYLDRSFDPECGLLVLDPVARRAWEYHLHQPEPCEVTAMFSGPCGPRLCDVFAGSGSKLGLANVSRRLELCYGTSNSLAISSSSAGTRVEFLVPFAKIARA